MTEKKRGLSLSLDASSMAEIRKALPIVASIGALLTLWIGWSGFQKWRDDQLSSRLQQSSNAYVTGVQKVMSDAARKLSTQLATAPVQAALKAGDNTTAAQALTTGWKTATPGQIFPADLGVAYQDMEAFGLGKLALLEQAIKENKAAVMIVRDGKQARIGVAAPAASQIAYVALPLSAIEEVLKSANAPDRTYIALRQGSYTVFETGDQALAGGSESLARSVKDTGLRVVAALPEGSNGAFGLGATPSFIIALVLASISALSLLLLTGKLKWPSRSKPVVLEDDSLSMADALLAERTAKATAKASLAEAARQQALGNTAVDETAKTGVELLLDTSQVDKSIFRTYDIRGVIGETLNVSVAELIGLAIGTVMEEQGLHDIAVGRDGRLSGPELSAALIEGLRKSGRHVIDIGLAPTPVAYFAAYHLRTGSSVAVTGSHNPPDYNGFKIVVGGLTLSGDAITDLYTRISQNRLLVAQNKGNLQERQVDHDYIQRIANDVQLDRPLKIVVDAGNGVAGDIAPRLFEAIGAEIIPLYCEVDGNFPNHHPDPSEPHNLEDLISMVKQFNADLGIAFDGDGDRLGVVTASGEVIFPDRLLMLFASDVLERNPGSLVIFDVKCTGKLQNWILRHGGTPMMWQTGHSLIKAKMRETGAALAGEMSGHFFFQERWYGFDDGMYAAARLLEILAARAESPEEILTALPSGIATPEIKVPVPASDNPHEIVQQFVDNSDFPGARLSTIDGLRADWNDGWGLIRASNTTPILVLRFEGDNTEALGRIKQAFRDQLAIVAPHLANGF